MKHYIAIRNNKPTYIGRHGAPPRDAICEISRHLVGKCFKIVFEDGKYKAVLDEIAEAERLKNVVSE